MRIRVWSSYVCSSDLTKPKVALAWSPVSSLLLRGSYNEGFRAPTLAQVFVGEISRRSGGVPDPYRVDVTGTPADLGDETRQVVRGGNANLGPEEAKQHSFGFVFQPTFLRSEEHTSELQSIMSTSYAVFCLKKKKHKHTT